MPPHIFFSRQEIAIWRNMATWCLGQDVVDVDLPGPAEWWPENYDYKRYGFEIPDIDNGHEEAFAMLHVNDEPERYAFVFPADDDLRVMEDTAEARFIQRAMI